MRCRGRGTLLTEQWHDRYRLTIVSVSGANTSGGFGSVYFTTGSPRSGDIKVADMTFDVEHKYADSGSSTLTGSSYVTD